MKGAISSVSASVRRRGTFLSGFRAGTCSAVVDAIEYYCIGNVASVAAWDSLCTAGIGRYLYTVTRSCHNAEPKRAAKAV